MTERAARVTRSRHARIENATSSAETKKEVLPPHFRHVVEHPDGLRGNEGHVNTHDGEEDRPSSGDSWLYGSGYDTPPDTPTRNRMWEPRFTDEEDRQVVLTSAPVLKSEKHDDSSDWNSAARRASGAATDTKGRGEINRTTLKRSRSRESPGFTRTGLVVARRKDGPVWEELGKLEPEPYDPRGSVVDRHSHRTITDHPRLPARSIRPKTLPKLSPERMARINQLAMPKPRPDKEEPSDIEEHELTFTPSVNRHNRRATRRPAFDPTE